MTAGFHKFLERTAITLCLIFTAQSNPALAGADQKPASIASQKPALKAASKHKAGAGHKKHNSMTLAAKPAKPAKEWGVDDIYSRPPHEFGFVNDYAPSEQIMAFMETDGMERRGLEQSRNRNRLDFTNPPGTAPKSVFGFDGDVEDLDATWRFCVCPQRSRIVEMRLNW